MKNFSKKRMTAATLAFSMLFSLLPVSASAASDYEEEEIRQMLLGSADESTYPDGVFDFLTPQMTVSEDMDYVEFAIVRRGNTQNPASVTFRSIDVSAKYGEDYYITVPQVITQDKLEMSEDSMTFIEMNLQDENEPQILSEETDENEVTDAQSSEELQTAEESDEEYAAEQQEAEEVTEGSDMAETVEEQIEETESVKSFDADSDDTILYEETDDEEVSEEASLEETEIIESSENTVSEEKLEKNVNTGNDLRSAEALLKGTDINTSNWRLTAEANDEENPGIEEFKAGYNELYAQLPAAEYTLEFDPGEYLKKLRFYCINDDISEDDEQVLFVLTNAEGCALTENASGYVNIQDDEEKEAITYAFAEESVSVPSNAESAVVTLTRTSGIYRYGTVEIGTAEEDAVSGTNYEPFRTELIFLPGQKSQTIEIPILSHPTRDTLSFKVSTADGVSTTIYLKPPVSSEQPQDTNTVELMSVDDAQTEIASAPNRWTRSYTIKTESNKLQVTNYNSSAVESHKNQDLSMVGKITFDSISYSNGTYWRKKFLWWTTSSGYYRDYASFLKIGTKEVWSKNGFYGAWRIGDTYKLDDSDRKETEVTFGFKTWGKTKDAMGEFGTEKYYYLPIEIILPNPSATDTDANVPIKTWSSSSSAKTTSTVYAGSMQFKGGGESIVNGTKKFFYNTDTVVFEPSYSENLKSYQKKNIYLWGFKIERKPGSGTDYYYVPGTSFSIYDLFNGKLQGYIEDPTSDPKAKKVTVDKSTTLMTDSSEGEEYYAYRIYPVYRQKKAYVKITADDTKSQFNAGTFKNDETVAIGVLDSMQINLAGKGDYSVSGYSYYGQTPGGAAETTADTERSLIMESVSEGDIKIQVNSPYYYKNSNWPTRTILNADAQDPGSYLFSPTLLTDDGENAQWTPRGENHLVVLYEKPEINVSVNPRAANTSDQSVGQIAYGSEQVSKFEGTYVSDSGETLNRGSEISVSPYRVGETYQFLPIYNNDEIEENYRTVWSDMTGDINRDGILSKEEVKALGSRYDAMAKGSVVGTVFNYTPTFSGNHTIYWNFEPKPHNETGIEQEIQGYITLKTNSVIDNTKGKPKKEKALEGVQVTVDGMQTVTDGEGHFSIKSDTFSVGEYHSVTATYANKAYTGVAAVNFPMNDFVIDEYSSFNVSNFSAYRVENKSEYENTEDWKSTSINPSIISNEDARHLYQFRVMPMDPTTRTVSKVEVKRYSKEGMLQDTYRTVYDESTDLYTIKDANVYDDENYSFNPASEVVVPGDYLTVVVYDQNNVADIEHEIGFNYKKALDTIGIINSFDSPFNGVVEFLGKVDVAFDLGMNTKLNSLVSENGEIVETEDPDSGVMTRTIKLGFSKNFKNDYDSSKKDDEEKDKKDGKTEGEILKDQVKDDKTTESQITDTAKDAVDKNSGNQETEKKSQMTSSFTVDLSIAFQLTMEAQPEGEHSYDYYFKDFVVTGVIAGSADAKYAYTTPIGLTVYVTGSLSGDITAIVAFEQYDDKRFYFTSETGDGQESGQINLFNAGNTDVNRDFDVYGKLLVNPTIKLGVGAGYDKMFDVSLIGTAKFNMAFTSAVVGSGKVQLSGEFVLELLNGLVTKKWYLGDISYDLFEYNNPGELYTLDLFGDADYRYDTLEYTGRDYSFLENRGEWNSGNNIDDNDVSIFSAGAESFNEQVLQTGAFPGAYPLIESLEPIGIKERKQVMFFLDDEDKDQNAELMYTIYTGDSGWTKPLPLDDDGTNDDSPITYDLGDKILILWSSADRSLNGDMAVDDMLNSRNIKARFLDKESQTFSPITYVTKTTDSDISADSAPAAAYTEIDGKGYLMLTYAKDECKVTAGADGDIAVGDVINPYTTIAYRFYDFENDEWVDSYDMETTARLSETLNDEQLETFANNWYGQGFVDLSGFAVVDETELVEGSTDGLWSRDPENSEITVGYATEQMTILENEGIGYENYAVSAFVVDMDGNRETLDDKEIFLQFYDFETGEFLPTVRLTNDTVPQSYVTLEKTPIGTSLYYISDGAIMEYDIGTLLNVGLLQTEAADGTDVMLLNKNADTYQSPAEIVTSNNDDMPISEFVVNSDGRTMFLIWTEMKTTYADGVDQFSEEAALPENQFAERQIYIQMADYNDVDQKYYDENGEVLTYPETDDTGAVIDWSVTPDINGETGKVKAGDEIVEHTQLAEWTNWVQLTDEQGANFLDIDSQIVRGGLLRIVTLKGRSSLQEIDGTLQSAVDNSELELITMDLNISYSAFTPEFDPATIADTRAQAETNVNINLRNESILDMNDVTVTLSMTKDGETTEIGTSEPIYLEGGEETSVVIPWTTPENLSGITLTAEVAQAGWPSPEWQCSYTFEDEGDQLMINDAYVTLRDRNTAIVNADISNVGNDTATDGEVAVAIGDETFYSDPIYLERDTDASVEIEIPIRDDMFVKLENNNEQDRGITERAEITVITDLSTYDLTLDRTADSRQVEFMESIEDVEIINAETGGSISSMNIGIGELLQLDVRTVFSSEEASVQPSVLMVSSDPDVVSVENGIAESIKNGKAEIHIYIYPPVQQSGDANIIMTAESLFAAVPSELIKEYVIPVKAGTGGTVSGGGGGGGASYYTVSFDTQGGSKIDSARINRNGVLTKPADPTLDGYTFDGWYIDAECTQAYDFDAKITSSFTLYAKWIKDSETPSVQEWAENPFIDVEEKDWFIEDVRYACEKGLLKGVSETEFAPNTPMSRAMLVTVLYRAEGEPDISGQNLGYPFADVDAESWYGDAVYWARLNNIVTGHSDEIFAPNDNITREQFAAIINRYAEFKGMDTSVAGDLTQFTDTNSVSDWAVENVSWAVGENLINGRDDGRLDPLGSTTRAEAAAILHRFLEN